jgi:hypothetical protein
MYTCTHVHMHTCTHAHLHACTPAHLQTYHTLFRFCAPFITATQTSCSRQCWLMGRRTRGIVCFNGMQRCLALVWYGLLVPLWSHGGYTCEHLVGHFLYQFDQLLTPPLADGLYTSEHLVGQFLYQFGPVAHSTFGMPSRLESGALIRVHRLLINGAKTH